MVWLHDLLLEQPQDLLVRSIALMVAPLAHRSGCCLTPPPRRGQGLSYASQGILLRTAALQSRTEACCLLPQLSRASSPKLTNRSCAGAARHRFHSRHSGHCSAHGHQAHVHDGQRGHDEHQHTCQDPTQRHTNGAGCSSQSHAEQEHGLHDGQPGQPGQHENHAGSHSHHQSHSHSLSHSHGQVQYLVHSHDHRHHHHHDDINHHHHHDHDHHHHDHDHFEETAVSRALNAVGILGLGSRLMHSNACTAISILCFFMAILSTRVLPSMLGMAQAVLVQKAALAVTFVLSGFPQVVESMCIAATGKVDTHVLMSLAVIGTLFMGMAQEGALLILLFQVSHMLEEKFTLRAKGGLEHLFASIPSQATLVELEPSGAPLVHAAMVVRADTVQLGQHVLVKPGEQVPLDGRVAWGTASVSMQHISGESHPLRVKEGSQVPAGSLNTDGLLVVQVTASTDDSTPARIARMTQAAQGAKPKLQRKLDEIGEIWSKAVIGVTLITLAVLPLLGVPFLGAHGALYRAMGVLTAGSPCAVVLVPLAYVCAISTVTRNGVLMKSAAALDLLHQCGTVALDKTGTLTTGDLTLTDVQVLRWTDSAHSSSTTQFLPAATATDNGDTAKGSTAISVSTDMDPAVRVAMQYCLSLAVTSNHPVSRAVVAAGGSLDGDDVQPVSAFEQVPGLGVRGECTLTPGATPMIVRFGSLEFVKENLPRSSPAALQLDEAEAKQKRDSGSKAMSFVTVTAKDADAAGDPVLVAMLRFEDIIDAGAPAAVRALAQGTWRLQQGSDQDVKDVVMLTGDVQQVAAHVARQLQVPNFRAGLKPDDKLAYVTSFRDDVKANGSAKSSEPSPSRRTGLLMMGDGINDAPALAAAHVGVAVASRPDDMVAAAADIIVLNGYGVANLPWLFKIAHKTHAVIQQNLALALLSVVFATLPTLAGVFPLWLAVMLHEGATLLVVLNSLRLLQDPQHGNGQALISSVAAVAENVIGSSSKTSSSSSSARAVGDDHFPKHVQLIQA